MSLFILVLRFTASLRLRVKPSCIFTYIGIFFSSVCRVTVFFEHVIIVEPGGMLRLRFIFFFKIYLLTTIWMPVKSWNPLQGQLKSQKKKYRKQSVHFWSPLKLSGAKNSERKLRYQLICCLKNNGLFAARVYYCPTWLS